MASKTGKSGFPRQFALYFTIIFVPLWWPQALFLPYDGVFKHVENIWHDTLFRLQRSSLRTGDPRVIIAAMDDDTGKQHGFPLPRYLHAQLLDRLKGYGVKTVAFDVLLMEPNKEHPEYDRQLVEATRRFKHVIHLFQTETSQTPLGEVVTVHHPLPGLMKASQYVGYPNVEQLLDTDGHLRRVMLFDARTQYPKDQSLIAPTMDVVALASFLDKPLSEVYERYANPLPRKMLLNFRVPRDWLRHPKADEESIGKVLNIPTAYSPYRLVSYMDILSGQLSAEQKKALRGSIVFVGSTSTGYFDHYPTPFIEEAPGVEYHCNIIDDLLHDDFLNSLSRGWILLAILFVIWLPLFLLRLSPAAGNAVAGGTFFGWFALGYLGFSRGWHVEFVAPSVALMLSFLVLTVHRVLTEGAEKKFIKNLFGQFVAPEVVDDLAKDPGKVKLGGEKRDMTIFFLDIAHFTTISEKMTPEALILFLNKYLSALSHIVHEEKGVIDKYIGDCIMAFWNAPIELPDHRARACLAAIGCQQMMKELNKDLDPGLPEVPAIRIGLNSGDATVGLTGSEKKLQYTVLGDEVNLASRLEGANKFFGSGIMASEATYDGAREAVEARELGRVRVVGKAVPIRVFELLAKKGELPEEWRKALPLYQKGVELFNRRQWDQAALAFEEVVKIFPKDGPSTLYLNAARDYSAIPPPDDWDGVFNLTAK